MNEKKNFNLDDLMHHPDFSVTLSKSPQEKSEDAKLRRFKEKWLFVTTLFVILVTFGACLAFVFLRENSQHTGAALNGMIGIAFALAGYFVRGKS